MNRYFNKIGTTSSSSTPQNEGASSTRPSTPNVNVSQNEGAPPSSQIVFLNLELQSDPGLRKSIQSYDPNVRDNVRGAYLQNGPCQPKSHDFPWTGEGRGKHRSQWNATNLHHYRVELFCTVIDDFLGELGSRFNEMNMELLLCVACLDPRDAFIAFDTRRLIRLAEFYPSDFSSFELVALEQQLENYIVDMRSDDRITKDIDGISDLCRTMIRLRKHHIYHMVFLLIKLALLLPVATATVERVFSAMKIIKSQLRNRLGDDLMNSCLITYIKKDVFESVDIELVIQRFQNMKFRRGSL